MLTDTLHCRALALPFDDFEAISHRARLFASPVGDFESHQDALVWRERIAFEAQGAGWSLEPVACEVVARIAVLRLESPIDGVGLTGVISPFGSLSGAVRHWLQRGQEGEPLVVTADLGAMLDDENLKPVLRGVGFVNDRFVVQVTALPSETLQGRPPEAVIQSLTLGGDCGPIELNALLDLTLPDPGEDDWALALGDIRRAYGLVKYELVGAGAAA